MTEENKSIYDGEYGDLAKSVKARFWKEHSLEEVLAVIKSEENWNIECHDYISSIISDYLDDHFWKEDENQVLGIDNELALTGIGVNLCITADILWSVMIYRGMVSEIDARKNDACKRIVYNKRRHKHLFKNGSFCAKLSLWSNKRFLNCCSPSKKKCAA